MVLKVIEVIGSSSEGFEPALQDAVLRSSKTVRQISGVDVISQTAKVKDGQIVEYRVTAKVVFIVED